MEDVEAVRSACYDYFNDLMEECNRCGAYAPFTELTSVIGIKGRICHKCVTDVKQKRYTQAMEPQQTLPLIPMYNEL